MLFSPGLAPVRPYPQLSSSADSPHSWHPVSWSLHCSLVFPLTAVCTTLLGASGRDHNSKPSAWLLGLWASLFSGILVEASVTSLSCACLQSQPTVMMPSPAASLGSEWLRPPYTAATAAFSRWPFVNRTLWWHSRRVLLVNLQFRTLEWGLTSNIQKLLFPIGCSPFL